VWPLWNAVARPASGGRKERILNGVLRRGEVTVAANQGAEDPRRELSQQVLDAGWDVQRSPFAASRNAPISSTLEGASSMT
jgi:hypothetical protein